MKYIMFEYEGVKYPIIFPSHILHIDMAKTIKNEFPKLVAISAGQFVTDIAVNDNRPYVCGESATLKLKSDPNDIDIINMHLQI